MDVIKKILKENLKEDYDEFLKDHCRTLVITAEQFEEIIGFMQDDETWKAQVKERLDAEMERRPIKSVRVLKYELKHLVTGRDYKLNISSAVSRGMFSNTIGRTPWIEYILQDSEAYPKNGWAVVGHLDIISNVPHIFLSLRDNDTVVAMLCGRIVLICDDPTVPTLAERGLIKGGI